MTISVYGINHTTSPLVEREKMAIARCDIPHALQSFLQTNAVAANEAVILSTCNRTEFYSDLPLNYNNKMALINWLEKFYQTKIEPPKSSIYAYEGHAVARHLMRVASGLNSMVLGETEIFGQVKDAYSLAKSHGSVGWVLGPLFETTFSVAKQVRTETSIGRHTLSLAYATTHLIKRIFSDISQKTVLFIGAGDCIKSIATYLKGQEINKFILASRDAKSSLPLVQQLSASYIAIESMPDYLEQVDIVISATSSPLPLLGKGAVERALKVRKHRPLLLIDLAVPRDIEPEIAELNDVFLYNIDDLKNSLLANRKQRESSIAKAEAIIETQSHRLMEVFRIKKAAHFIETYRQQAVAAQEYEIKKAQQALARGELSEQVIRQLAYALTNKLTHSPTVNLRQAALHKDRPYLDLLGQLFRIPQPLEE